MKGHLDNAREALLIAERFCKTAIVELAAELVAAEIAGDRNTVAALAVLTRRAIGLREELDDLGDNLEDAKEGAP